MSSAWFFVTGINWSGGSGEEAPKESIKFKFGAMGIQYIQQKPDGSEGTKMTGMWSTGTNKQSLDIPGLGAYPKYLDGGQA